MHTTKQKIVWGLLSATLILTGAGCQKKSTSPENILTQAQKNASELNSVHLALDIDGTYIGSNPVNFANTKENKNYTVKINLAGDTITKKNEDPALDMNLDINLHNDTESVQGSIGLMSKESVGNFIALRDLQIKSSALTFSLDTLKNNWYQMPESADSLVGKSSSAAEDAKSLTDSQKQFIELFKSNKLFTFKQDLGDIEENGIKYHHYSVNISKEALELMHKSAIESAQTPAEKDRIQHNIDMLSSQNVELYIVKDSQQIGKIKMNNISDYRVADNSTFNGNIAISFSKQNEISQINIPANYKTKDQFVQDLMQALLSEVDLTQLQKLQ